MSTNITYSSFFNVALEATNWEATIENLRIKYIHHKAIFSFINVNDGNDIKRMFKALRNDIYL